METLGMIWRVDESLCFLACHSSLCVSVWLYAYVSVCVYRVRPVMKITKRNLQPAICCGTPESFDFFESAIQIWDVNLNESRLLMTFHFHLPHQPFSLILWPRYRQMGLINLIPKSIDGWAVLHIFKYSGGEENEGWRGGVAVELFVQSNIW